MTPKQEAAIRKHGEQLNTIFHTILDPVTLCKKLRRIEGAAHKAATDYCNGTIEGNVFDAIEIVVLDRLRKLLNIDLLRYWVPNPNGKAGTFHNPVFVNRAPRGYALKIDDEYMREYNLKLYKDWGGYGILAPEFDKNGE